VIKAEKNVSPKLLYQLKMVTLIIKPVGFGEGE